MKFRTAVIVVAAGILAAGALLMPKESSECRVTSHSIIEEGGRQKVVGMSNCESGSVPLVLEDIPFSVTVENGLFGAWVEYEGDKPIAVVDTRKAT